MSSLRPLTVERATAATAEIRALIGALDAELAAEYLPEQQHGLKLDAIFAPHMRFFVARLGGQAVGCGGVALFADFAEVKRMYVAPPARGTGAAQAIMTEIEAAARGASLEFLRLETGDRQAAAMRFYRKCGFDICPVFGDYAALPQRAIATSIFMERRLSSR